ncbi:MAG: DUF6155 family protein [Nanoarchaeota archaeon]|nr:hypothetical protein [Nanoarchaeota archaeon]MBU4300003.1 hypothetical protein [Nanoarchaeota archaeon]MBU4451165.1 hypothetical protein [Nanoarchaeota archaeon]MCG2724308.1 DUF6155 family protein [archaeon]
MAELAELRRRLELSGNKELVKLILELAKLRKDNAAWLEAKLCGSEKHSESIEHYKQKILSGFYKRSGWPQLKLSEAKRAISDFKKASKDNALLIDLMIFYVETGTEFTRKYGDIDERFYSSMETMYDDAVKLLNRIGDAVLIDKFRQRLEDIVTKTKGMGWGYHDTLGDIYEELGSSSGESYGQKSSK